MFDCEVYPNYFLLAVRNIENGATAYHELRGRDRKFGRQQVYNIQKLFNERYTIGFNSRKYDLPIISTAVNAATPAELHQLSSMIISGHNILYKGLPRSIDLINVASTGSWISLKAYGAKLHTKTLQELLYNPNQDLTDEQIEELTKYCVNDLILTEELYRAIEHKVELRVAMGENYTTDIKSKSDAQIAEVHIHDSLRRHSPEVNLTPMEVSPNSKLTYKPPDFIYFNSPGLVKTFDDIKNLRFELNDNGSVKKPKEMGNIKVGTVTCKLGVGGMHTDEKSLTVIPGKDERLMSIDVTSYYPAIMINSKLYPKNIGPYFCEAYKKVVDERLNAKKNKDFDKSEFLKIVVNGTFGKFASKYSCLYSPGLLLYVTLTGQLCLLMLIEAIESWDGMRVISANTDGVVALVKNDFMYDFNAICKSWQLRTGFNLEEEEYKAIYMYNVNNYFAVGKGKGKDKSKGAFVRGAVRGNVVKNPQAEICFIAAEEYLKHGTDIYETILKCKDVRRFVHTRSVTKGGMYRDKYLGKVVRWIYVKNGDKIFYKVNGNKVPRSDGCRPMMRLPDTFPDDIDYPRYFGDTVKVINSVGSFLGGI